MLTDSRRRGAAHGISVRRPGIGVSHWNGAERGRPFARASMAGRTACKAGRCRGEIFASRMEALLNTLNPAPKSLISVRGPTQTCRGLSATITISMRQPNIGPAGVAIRPCSARRAAI